MQLKGYLDVQFVVDVSGKLSVDACTCTRTSNVALSVNVCGSSHFSG